MCGSNWWRLSGQEAACCASTISCAIRSWMLFAGLPEGIIFNGFSDCLLCFFADLSEGVFFDDSKP